MTDKAEVQTMGVYLPEGEGKPAAVLNWVDSNSPVLGDLINRIRALFGPGAIIAAADSPDKVNEDVKALFAAQAQTANVGNMAAFEVIAGEARTAARHQAMVEAVQKQSKADIDKSVKAQLKEAEETHEQQADVSSDDGDGGTTRPDPGEPGTSRASTSTSARGSANR